jgi:hypothetical protein
VSVIVSDMLVVCAASQPTSTADYHVAIVVCACNGYVCSCRIEPDGQRPKVLIHGKACRKTANPKCAYDTSDTRSGIEVGAECAPACMHMLVAGTGSGVIVWHRLCICRVQQGIAGVSLQRVVRCLIT